LLISSVPEISPVLKVVEDLLLIREPGAIGRAEPADGDARAAAGEGAVIRRRHGGRSGPPV